MKHMTIMLAAAMAVSGCTRTVKFDARGNAEPGSEHPGMATIVVSQRQADGFGTAWWQNVEIDDSPTRAGK